MAKCKLGIGHFNANLWRRAGNTVIQETGNEELIEATSRQLTHSRVQGRTSYYNDVSAIKSAASHTQIMEKILCPNTSTLTPDTTTIAKRQLSSEDMTVRKKSKAVSPLKGKFRRIGIFAIATEL